MARTHEIPATSRRVIVHHDWGGTKDIMQVIMGVVNNESLSKQVAAFAEQYRGETPQAQKEGLNRLWLTCRNEIRYREDKAGTQAIKHPARTWADREADCKSLTVFIYHCCRALDIPCFVRFSSYEKDRNIGHVYPVAVIAGQPVAVDAVWHRFDDEKPPTYFENHLPRVFAKDASMHRVITYSKPNTSAISGITTGWHQLASWQKAIALFAGGWTIYKIST